MCNMICEHPTQLQQVALMDKASDFESEDCEFESRRGHVSFNLFFQV